MFTRSPRRQSQKVRARPRPSRLLAALVSALLVSAAGGAAHARDIVLAPQGAAGPNDIEVKGAIDDEIAALLAEGGPLSIRLAPGDYRLGKPIVLPSRVSLTGAGAGLTRLTAGFSGRESAMMRNPDPEAGGQALTIGSMTLDCAGRTDWGLHLTRVSDLTLHDLELTGCRMEGARVSGRGQPTRGLFAHRLHAHHNGADGLLFMWATREAFYSDLRAHHNGRHGVTFDHSEAVAVNVIADSNKGAGVHLRNLFASSFTNIAATRNGEHGILVQGMVASVGASWRAQNNSVGKPGAFDDVFFSADASLSYGLSRDSSIAGLITGASEFLGQTTERHGVHYETGLADVAITGWKHGDSLNAPVCRTPLHCRPRPRS